MGRVLDDCDDSLEFFGGDFTSAEMRLVQSCGHTVAGRGRHIPLVQVHIGFLADQIGVATTDTLDLCQCVHDLLLAIDVGVEKSKDELEVRLLTRHESWPSVSIILMIAACSIGLVRGFWPPLMRILTHDGQKLMIKLSLSRYFDL